MQPDRNEAIQWLRALAAVEVMVWHSDLVAKGISPFSIQTSVYSAFGGIGVEVFFVVSGFLMSFITQSNPGPKPFLLGRIRRIYPLYWFFTALVVGAYLANSNWHLGGFSLTAAKVVGSLTLWPQEGYPILTVGWTLEYEIVFYLIVAAFTTSALSRDSRSRALFGPFLAFLGFLGVLVPDISHIGPAMAHIFTPYMFAFGFGWLLHSAPQADASGARAALMTFSVLAVAALSVAEDHDAVVMPRSLAAGVAVAGMLALRPLLARAGAVNRTIASIGEASYSIYLCHWFVLSALGKLAGQLNLAATADGGIRIVGCLIAIAAGWLFFMRVERPLDRRLRGMPKAASAVAVRP